MNKKHKETAMKSGELSNAVSLAYAKWDLALLQGRIEDAKKLHAIYKIAENKYSNFTNTLDYLSLISAMDEIRDEK